MQTLFRIAYRNVKLNWRHSLAAILSIVASFFALVVFEGYMKDIAYMYYDAYRNRAMYGDFIIENKDINSVPAKSEPWKYFLNENQQSLVDDFLKKHQDQIFDRVRFLSLQGLITNGKSSTIFFGFGHDTQNGAHVRKHWAWNALYGVPLYQATVDHPIVLGQTLAHTLGCQPVQKEVIMSPSGSYYAKDRPFTCLRNDIQMSLVTDSGQLNAMDFNIVGLVDAGYQEVDGKFVSLPIQDAQTLLNTKKITFETVELNDIGMTDDFEKSFHEDVIKKDPSLHLIKWQDHRAGDLYVKTMSLLSIFRNFVVLVILSISILSVMNTMVKIIKERTKEVGTLLSLGFQRVHILWIFVFESIFLSLIGTGIGFILAPAFSFTINKLGILYKAGMLSEPVVFNVDIVPLDYLFVATMLLIISGVTTAFSIRSTLKRKIIDCLQHS